MTTLIRNAVIITMDPDRTVYDDGAMLIDGSRIEEVGPTPSVCARHRSPDEVIDARGKVVLPGFVSAHNHLGYAVFRGRAEDVGHAPTHRLYLPMSDIITRQERLDIGSLAIVELMRGGVTTVLEMEEDGDIFAPFIEQVGLRAGIGVMVNDVNLGALSRGETVFDAQVRAQQVEQAITFAEQWHNKADGRIQAVLAVTSLSTSSPALLTSIRDHADRLKLPVSIHLATGERALVRTVHGKRLLEYAEEHGMLGPDIIAVHCYDLEDGEIAPLADSATHLVHCPLMNQFRGRIAPVMDLRERGMNVGLGIDNYFSDYFDLLRACIAGARIRAQDPEVMQADEVLELATINAARALGLDNSIGSLEKGKRADLQVVDMCRLGLTPINDAVRTLVYHGHAKDVEKVMIDGRWVVDDGCVVGVDTNAMLTTAGSASNAAWHRFAARHGGFVAASPE